MYSDYTYTQSVSESTRFRSGIGLGYSTSKRNVLWEKGAAATPVSSKGEHLTLQVDGEIRQNLDKGWFLTPWADSHVDLHGKTKVATTQMGASHDISTSTKVWEFGTSLNEGKQLTDGLNMEFGPYYRHGATRNAELILDGNKFKMGGIKFNEYGFRVAATF